MKFSYYFKENLLAKNIKTNEVFKILNVKRINENSFNMKVITQKRKLDNILIEKDTVKKFKFYNTKRVGKKLLEFEEILSLLNENEGANVSGSAFGANASAPDQFSSDWYAPNDARNLYGALPNKMYRRDLKNMESFTKYRKKKNKKKISKRKSSDKKQK